MAAEIFGRPLTPAHGRTRSVIDRAIEAMLIIADEDLADLVEELALAVIAREDELRSLRVVLADSLTQTYAQHVEILGLRARRDALLEERRTPRSPEGRVP